MRYLPFLLLGLLAACSDDTSGNNNPQNNGDLDAGMDVSTDTSVSNDAGLRPVGASCTAASECQSNVCENNVCAPPTTCTAPCGQACCGETQECVLDTCVEACTVGERCVTEAGPVCCGGDQACLFSACIDLGAACSETEPCAVGQYCEPTANRCVDRNANPNECVYVPPVGVFNPTEAWAWTGSPVSPEYDQVMMMPAVANLSDDNGDQVIDREDTPDVVFVTFKLNQYNADGVLRVISGADGTEHWSSSAVNSPFFVQGGTIPALADIDADGVVEILIGGGPGIGHGLYAIEHDGTVKWHQPGVPNLGSRGPAVANLDGAGAPEIMTPGHVLSATGDIICALPTTGLLPFAVDMDGDGQLEVVHGSTLYRMTNGAATDGTGCEQIQTGSWGGYTAVANLDDEPTPEIVEVAAGAVVLRDADGTEKWRFPIPLDPARIESIYGITDCAAPLPQEGLACTSSAQCGSPLGICSNGTCRRQSACAPGGGPPTVADFDGDGRADIAVAARWFYFVFKQDGTVLWAHPTKDYSSAVTGSSVFDFEGDGKAEVVYNDELFLRVYSGAGKGVDEDNNGFNDPEILVEIPNSSGTLLEYPLIVDVNNDGNAEIVVAANNYSTQGSTTKGIRVFADASDNWVGTRRIWNQHAYHVTNVDEDGQIPMTPLNNWEEPGLNNFRQNVQGDGLFNAPNLLPANLAVDADNCATGGITISFEIKNDGALGVRAGSVTASIYVKRAGQNEEFLQTVTNTRNLAPGAAEAFNVMWTPPNDWVNQRFDVRVVVDENSQGEQNHNECREDDNEATVLQTLCSVPQ